MPLLVPWPGNDLEAFEVSRRVNSTQNDGPECLAKALPPAQGSLF